MKKILAAAALAALLAGCTTPVVLRNLETKEMAQCEVPPPSWWGAWGQSHGVNSCAEAYERAEFTRLN